MQTSDKMELKYLMGLRTVPYYGSDRQDAGRQFFDGWKFLISSVLMADIFVRFVVIIQDK